jgi:hypothetical protein
VRRPLRSQGYTRRGELAPEARKRQTPGVANPPANPEPENPFELVDALEPLQRAFVVRLLETGDLDEAMRAAERSSSWSCIRILGDPRVRAALERCAPLCGSSERAARILAPYAMERLSRVLLSGGNAQAISAARDMLAIAGEGPSSASKGVDLAGLVRGLARARRAADRAEGGPNGIGLGAEKPALPAACRTVVPDSVSGNARQAAPARTPPGAPRHPRPPGGANDPNGAG